MTTVNDEERIKLAEAMGWKWEQGRTNKKGFGRWLGPDGRIHHGERVASLSKPELPFDPTEDANDDFEVLEWMRGKDYTPKNFQRFYEALRKIGRDREGSCPGAMRFCLAASQYQIGDYAKAAITVLQQQRTNK